MHHHQHIMFIDIETVPIARHYDAMSERMQLEWEKKARFLKKDAPEDVTYSQLFSEKAGVYAEFAKVVCVSFGSLHHTDGKWMMRLKSIALDDEKQLLSEFADVVSR